MNKSCKICGEPATVYVVDLKNGNPVPFYICNKCAAKMNIVPQHFQILDIFKEFMQPHAPIEDIKCGDCGMTFSEFNKHLRFGCAHDYDLFNAESVLKQIHGTTKHVGKTPKPDYKQIRTELQSKLDDAVKIEDYEAAAKLRDQIRALPKVNDECT